MWKSASDWNQLRSLKIYSRYLIALMLFLKSLKGEWTLIGYTRLTHPVYSGASEGHSIMVNSQVPGVPSDPRSCAGCGGKIADRFLLFSMERYWHTRCLKCSCCQAQLGDIGTTCYSKGGMILCRSDYIRWEPEEGGKESCWFLDFRGRADLTKTKTKSLFLCLQTVWAQRGVQCLQPVNSSQRNGDEGTGKCLPPQGKSPALTLLCFISRSLFDRSI